MEREEVEGVGVGEGVSRKRGKRGKRGKRERRVVAASLFHNLWPSVHIFLAPLLPTRTTGKLLVPTILP